MAQRFLVVIGTRPEAVKLAPVVHALESLGAEAIVCLTGQHGDMLTCCLESLQLFPQHECVLEPGDTLAFTASEMIAELDIAINRFSPTAIVVVGDTASALAGAMAGMLRDIPVVHVEAGLRTYSHDPWPEENIRRSISGMAYIHFAPTVAAVKHLVNEGHNWHVHLTGNPVVDSLQRNGVTYDPNKVDRNILVTLHRRENWPQMKELAKTIVDIAWGTGYDVTWPVHPNVTIRRAAEEVVNTTHRLKLLSPVPYDEFLRLMCRSALVITDSGGVQEEAAVLGIPTLVVRQCTERPEAVQLGTSRLVCSSTQLEAAACEILNNPEVRARMCRPSRAFGDGLAGQRIAELLVHGAMLTREPDLTEREVYECQS